jgi:indolepyruvate ferredoxin oxidoreductase beta subunit
VESLKEFNVVVTGVGGQGTLLLSRLIAAAARREGFDVQTGETLGMAQRGGSVISFVRYGQKIFTPIVPDYKADLLISLEPIEALRSIRYIRNATRILLNTRPKPPLSTILGEAKYPDVKEIEAVLKSVDAETFAFDAVKLAETAGDARAANVTMLGGMAALRESSIKVENFREALKEVLPERLIQVNMQAFKLGYDTVILLKSAATSEVKNLNSNS